METYQNKHEFVHQKATEKVWNSGRWHVAPLTKEHRDNMVISFVYRKFRDTVVWVTVDLVDAAVSGDAGALAYIDAAFEDKSFYREPGDGESLR